MIARVLLAIAMLAFGATAARAGGTCTPSSAGIAFGFVSRSQARTVGSIVLTCTGSGSFGYAVTLSTGASGSYAVRRMGNGSASVAVNLYRDPAYTQVWGDGSGGSNVATGTVSVGSSASQTVRLPIYAKLPPQTAPSAGVYSDTITVSATTDQGTRASAFAATAAIDPDCAISASDLAFGAYSGSTLDGQSQISLTCTSGLPWNVGLSQGTAGGATVTTRKMTGPDASMAYWLYRDFARTLNWGDTVGTDTAAGTGTGSAQILPVYGRIPGSQSLPAGTYRDTIVATVTF